MDTAIMTPPKKKETENKKGIKPYVIRGIKVEEVLDETGQVNESTIVKLKADDGIIWFLSVGAAYKLERDLRDSLGL